MKKPVTERIDAYMETAGVGLEVIVCAPFILLILGRRDPVLDRGLGSARVRLQTRQ